MFKTNTPLYLKDVIFTTEKGKDTTRKMVACVFEMQPFTREMAASVDMQNRLFGVTDGEPLPGIIRAELSGPSEIKQMSIKMAPDQGADSLTVRNVRIGSFKVRKDKEGPVFAAKFSASFYYPEAKELLFLANGVNEQHYVTFEPEQGDMLTQASTAPALRPGVEAEFTDPRDEEQQPAGNRRRRNRPEGVTEQEPVGASVQ